MSGKEPTELTTYLQETAVNAKTKVNAGVASHFHLFSPFYSHRVFLNPRVQFYLQFLLL